MTDNAYRSVIAETYLWSTVTGLAAVTAAFGTNVFGNYVALEDGMPLRRLEIVRHPGSIPFRALVSNSIPTDETFTFDIVGWDAGHTTDAIVAAMRAIDAALITDDDHIQGDWELVFSDEGELPPAPPPRPGDAPAVRLGKQYGALMLSRIAP